MQISLANVLLCEYDEGNTVAKEQFMVTILQAILFGIVEGVTEWLPISSTGHLILLDALWPLPVSPEFRAMFDVVIQLGAIFAVIILFFSRLNPFDRLKSDGQKIATWRLWGKVILAILPSGLVGVLLDDWMEAKLHNAAVVAAALMIYGIAFIVVERMQARKTVLCGSVDSISWGTAFAIGLFQCLSLVPGTSRSGATILGGLLCSVSRGAAAEFSFFMAIPTMLGASAIKLLKFFLSGTGFGAGEAAILAVGSLVSFFVSLFAIRGLINYVRRHSFAAFGVYRIVLGAVVLAYFGVMK